MTTGSHQTFNTQLQTYNTESKIYAFATSSDSTSIKGQFEPGSYVVSDNNWSKEKFTTKELFSSHSNSTRTINVKEERGTNATIDLYNNYMNPERYDPNGNNNQSCQAPVRPFTINRQNAYGIGAATIGSSFVIGNYYLYGGNVPQGIGYSTVGGTFNIGSYGSGIGIGNATVGSTFIIGSFDNVPRKDFNYVPHKSNTLLGNIIIGKKSKKYFKYQTYSY
jgi:hypothetical protein